MATLFPFLLALSCTGSPVYAQVEMRLVREKVVPSDDFLLPENASECPRSPSTGLYNPSCAKYNAASLGGCWCQCGKPTGKHTFYEPTYSCIKVSEARQKAGCDLLFTDETVNGALRFFPTSTVFQKAINVPVHKICSFYFEEKIYAQYLSCDGKWNEIPSQSVKQSLEVNLGWTISLLHMRRKDGVNITIFQNNTGRIFRVAVQCRSQSDHAITSSTCVMFKVEGNTYCQIPQLVSSRPSATLPSPTSEIVDTRTTPVDKPTTGQATAVTSEKFIISSASEEETISPSTFFQVDTKVKPSILKERSPPSVICEMQTLCLLSCLATSDYAVTYSWTKDGHDPDSDIVEVLNNSIFVRPRRAQDYGVYVCNASNSFGFTTYKVTLTEFPRWLISTNRNHEDNNQHNIPRVAVIALCCVVVLLLIMNIVGVLVWRKRRALPPTKTDTSNSYSCHVRVLHGTPRDQHVSEPGSYTELYPTTSVGEPRVSSVYASFQGRNTSFGHHNGVVQGGDTREKREDYKEVGERPASPPETNSPDEYSTNGSVQYKTPGDQQVSERGSYMEIHPRTSVGQSRVPAEYASLQGKNTSSGYYNVAVQRGNREKNEEDYEEMDNVQA